MLIAFLVRPLVLIITIICCTMTCSGMPFPSTLSCPNMFIGGGEPASSGLSSTLYAIPRNQSNASIDRLRSLGKRFTISTYVNRVFMPGVWIARLEVVQSFLPIQPAAASLEHFLETAVNICLRQFQENSMVRTSNIAFGPFILDIYARDNDATIPWMMIASFLTEVKMMAERGLEGTFSGEIASAMTGWTIYVRLRIRGFPEPTWGHFI